MRVTSHTPEAGTTKQPIDFLPHLTFRSHTKVFGLGKISERFKNIALTLKINTREMRYIGFDNELELFRYSFKMVIMIWLLIVIKKDKF